MPNSPEMSRFLYTILKQLDLKSINWAQVSSELGITNGHAARMRYSRFKQQMEGNPPVRRARNPAAKRAPKQKRPKEESKDLKVKTEPSSSIHDSMNMDTPSLSPSLSMPGFQPDYHSSMTPEAVPVPVMVKPEPNEDSSCSSTVTRPELTASHSRSHSSLPSGMSSPILAEQQQMQSHPDQQVQTMADFHFSLSQDHERHQQQIHHQQGQRIFQSMNPQVHDLLEAQNLSAADMSALIDTHNHDQEHEMESMPFMMEMYHHPMGVGDMGAGCHLMGQDGLGPMGSMGPMVKVEERWDASYGR